jgi:predicted dehydrogenase
MSRLADKLKDPAGNPLHLATGHQRHYNVKYDNAINLIKWGLLGQLHHIRAQWHRSNVPGTDSWKMPLPGGELSASGVEYDDILADINNRKGKLKKENDPDTRMRLEMELAQLIAWDADKNVDASKHGYQDFSIGDDLFTATEELHRWRLFDRTGAGLMAELGSHQLDAVSIFLSSLRDDKKKVHPLSVHAVGGRHMMPRDRQAGDHVYCMFEFPGPEYDPTFDIGYYDKIENYPGSKKLGKRKYQQIDPVAGYDTDPNKKVVVTYSSINGNGFGGWGEVVMGSKGTLILDKETDVLLYRNSDTSSKVGVSKQSGGYALDTSASGDYAAPRLPRRNRALGLLHPQSFTGKSATLLPASRHGRCGDCTWNQCCVKEGSIGPKWLS